MPDWLEIVFGLLVGLAFICIALVMAFRSEFRFPRHPSRLPGQTDSVDRGMGKAEPSTSD